MGMHPTMRNDPAPDGEGGMMMMTNDRRNDQAPGGEGGTTMTNNGDAPND